MMAYCATRIIDDDHAPGPLNSKIYKHIISSANLCNHFW